MLPKKDAVVPFRPRLLPGIITAFPKFWARLPVSTNLPRMCIFLALVFQYSLDPFFHFLAASYRFLPGHQATRA